MILDDTEFIEISKLVLSKSYNQNFKGFVKTLWLTRIPFLKKNELFMRGIQAGMLDTLSQMQNSLRDYESKLPTVISGEEKQNIEKSILVEKQWIRTLQTIADGIAWRMFNFDRPILRHMSQNNSSGHIQKNDYDYLGVLKKYLRSLRGFPIVNDLTRILRIADFTVIHSDEKKILYEIKERGKKIFDVGQIFYEISKSKKLPNSQKQRHLSAQMAILERKVKLTTTKESSMQDSFEAEIADLEFPIKHHFSSLKKLIKLADKKGIANAEVEDGYFIQVVAVDKLGNKNIRDHVLKSFVENHPTWAKKNPNVHSLSNYDSFYEAEGQFTRIIIPYSVLPLSAKNCIRLMMGHLWVTVMLDTSRIKEKLEKRGWRVSDVDTFSDENFQKLMSRKSVKEKADLERFFDIQKDDENGTFTGSVSFIEIMITISSFYSIQFLVDIAEASYERSRQVKKSGYITHNYLGERKVLI